MRVLQIIDSLDAGGAERMAINYANALSEKIEFSGLVVTRKEGDLKEQLSTDVKYFFLNKKKKLDIKAVFLLKKIIKKNKIDIIHAHSSSFFITVLVKLVYFKIKIVFHEHNGHKNEEAFIRNIPLIFCLPLFSKILVVNHQLETWYLKLGIKKAVFFSNFAVLDNDIEKKTKLKGSIGKRILLLANLKKPKNHVLAIRAFYEITKSHPDWSIHFVGKIYKDDYFEKVSELISKLKLEEKVFLYDSKSDVLNILQQATIGVLCSTYEGFPVTILEYGIAKLPVIASNVGYCSELIVDKKTGFLFESENCNDFTQKVLEVVSNIDLANQMGENLNTVVNQKYSKDFVISNLIKVYNLAKN
jgi:glycosyltransferase involved in cell wall biosynthesis